MGWRVVDGGAGEREWLESLLRERLSKYSPSRSSLFAHQGERHPRFKLAFLGSVCSSFIKLPLNSALKHSGLFSLVHLFNSLNV